MSSASGCSECVEFPSSEIAPPHAPDIEAMLALLLHAIPPHQHAEVGRRILSELEFLHEGVAGVKAPRWVVRTRAEFDAEAEGIRFLGGAAPDRRRRQKVPAARAALYAFALFSAGAGCALSGRATGVLGAAPFAMVACWVVWLLARELEDPSVEPDGGQGHG